MYTDPANEITMQSKHEHFDPMKRNISASHPKSQREKQFCAEQAVIVNAANRMHVYSHRVVLKTFSLSKRAQRETSNAICPQG